MAVRTGTLVWLRDVAITAAVVAAGFVALGTITGHAYAGLPLAAPARTSNAPQAAIVSPHGPQPVCASCHRAHVAPDPELLVAAEADSSICVQCHNSGGEAPMSAHSNMDSWATEAPSRGVRELTTRTATRTAGNSDDPVEHQRAADPLHRQLGRGLVR
jgi:predicted CXXCH cytochrome family protein